MKLHETHLIKYYNNKKQSKPKSGKMDIVLKEAIKIPNSVIIKGLTNSDLDEEVAIYLEKQGSVNRHIRIDDPHSEFYRLMIAEFNHVGAIDTLNPLLPHTIQSSAQPKITFEIRSLAEVYAANARNVTRAYMKQLSEMANLSRHSRDMRICSRRG